jgi:Tfp pilus assembly protein PilF
MEVIMDFEKVRQQLEEALRNDPLNDDILCKLAIATIETRDFERGLDILRKAVEMKPNVQTLTNLGYFYLHEGEPTEEGWFHREDKAIQVLERARGLNPMSHFTYSVLGEAYLKTDQNPAAQKTLTIAVEIEPTSANVNNLGVALFRLGKYSEAAEHFSQSHLLRRKDSHSLYPYLNYGFAQSKLGNSQGVNEIGSYLQQYTNLKSFDGVNSVDLMNLYYDNNDYRNCIKFFEVTRGTFSIGPGEFGSYLFSLYQLGQSTKAKEVYEQVLDEIRQCIEDIGEDDDLDLVNKDWQTKSLLKKIQEFTDIYLNVEKGIRPTSTFEPMVETQCYMFGCLRHGNPTYSETIDGLEGQGDIL